MTEIHGSHPQDQSKKIWFEPVTAILMGVASLSTAWCSFQNSRWGGLSSDLGASADKTQREAIALHLDANQIQAVHVEAFTECINAQLDGNEKKARFYSDRFGGELKPAYEKWIAMKPFENPAAPPSPFVPALYTPRFEDQIRDSHAKAAKDASQSSEAGKHAANYLGNTVIFASVLFFAGMADKFDQRRVRRSALAFAIALFAYAAVRMLLLPVT